MAASTPQVQDTDRLAFTVFLALALHGSLIMGLSFSLSDATPTPHTLEVTLAQFKTDQEIQEADFLAQENQEGSGTLEEKQLLSTTELAEFQDNQINETQAVEATSVAPKASNKATDTLNQTDSDFVLIDQKTKDMQENLDLPEDTKKIIIEKQLEIASLEAKLARERQTLAKQPRIHRLTSLSTMKAADAVYMNKWIADVERIGNLNYPAESKRNNIYGDVRLMVAIKPDGTVFDVEVLQSSGHRILDDAAIQIVRMAAPFEAFSDAMKKETDVLEIIRTWQFKKNNYLSSKASSNDIADNKEP